MKNITEDKIQTKQSNCQNPSCACGETNNTMQDLTAISNKDKKEEVIKELDPTHFGDWQVKGRAIDF